MGSKDELVIHPNKTMLQLRSLLADKYNIPLANLSVGKPRKYQMKDITSLESLTWHRADDEFVLSTNPWNIQDG